MKNRPSSFLLVLLLLLLLTIVITYLSLLIWALYNRKKKKKNSNTISPPPSLFIVLGSGGHTAEMISFVETLSSNQFSSTTYWGIANTDVTSIPKLLKNESSFIKEKTKSLQVYSIPRSREVKQNWITTIFTTLYAILYSVYLIFKLQPDIILVNGPGTCVPICLSAKLLDFITCKQIHCKIIFVESFCRVKSLSLSGRILYPFVDEFLVQWPLLVKDYPRAKYLGIIY
jgi:beta-1,4-N-acetylglucosaminyltransferase